VLAPPEPMSGPVGLLAGPRRDWFDDDAWSTLLTASWDVTDAVSRVGMRLRGPRLEWLPDRRGRELAPEGLVRGALQVPPDGQPVVMLADHPTTGGYPVLAVVDDGALDELARLGPGSTVRFRTSTI
jgi:allophanate hydrolase subunit 2